MTRVEIAEIDLQDHYKMLNADYFGGELPPCRVEWSNLMTRNAALVWPGRRLIRLSLQYHLQTNYGDFLNSMLHEMAHISTDARDGSAEMDEELARLETPKMGLGVPVSGSRWRQLWNCTEHGDYILPGKYNRRSYYTCRCGKRGTFIRNYQRPIEEVPA